MDKTTKKAVKKPVKTKKTSKEKTVVKLAKPKSTVVNRGKQETIKQFASKEGDTGSPEVQVALLTQKVTNLQKHLEENPKDNHSRRGLLKVVSKRRRIINYLQKKDQTRYKILIKKLGLKK